MDFIGYIAAIFIGLTLGLIGGGGSILTVPIMVYLFDKDPVYATAYSLFVVGATSMVGTLTYVKKQQISYKVAAIFAAPALVTVFATRKFLIPALPENILTFSGFTLTKGLLMLLVFAVLMILASVKMIKKVNNNDGAKTGSFNYPLMVFQGVFVGFLTGFVGAGGGFLIVPALVLLAKLPMKTAVGTSLLIITVNSLIGFMGDVWELTIEWQFLFIIMAFAIGGIFIGSYLSKFIDGKKLKPIFGYFVLIMGIYIISAELYKNLQIENRSNSMNSFTSQAGSQVINLDSDTFENSLKKDTDAVLLDTRTLGEFNDGHLPNAQLCDIMSPDFMDKLEKLDKSKTYYVYCRSGNRSYQAGRIMLGMGFEKVYNLEDGIISWNGQVEY